MSYPKSRIGYAAAIVGLALLVLPGLASAATGSFIGTLTHIREVASTVPKNGDLNPYGVAVVQQSTGALVQGNILVSNFNNSANLQGTGTTIVEIAPNGSRRLFAQLSAGALPGSCPGGVGLTTALVALRDGWVIVGSLPTTDGTAATAQAGCLIVLDSHGQPVETFSGGPINGPWDMTAQDNGDYASLFVTNVLNGTVAAGGKVVNRGTVLRINLTQTDDMKPSVVSEKIIGSGFGERTDPAALVIGPTGVGLSNGTLYVADTLANRIAAIPNALTRSGNAGTGTTVAHDGGLNAPLGLAIAPNSDILTVNANDGNMVETTPQGSQVAVKTVDVSTHGGAGGDLFGLAIAPGGAGVYFVNDGNNKLYLLH